MLYLKFYDAFGTYLYPTNYDTVSVHTIVAQLYFIHLSLFISISKLYLQDLMIKNKNFN